FIFLIIDNILLTVNSVLSTNSFDANSFKVYPNPAKNLLNIDSASNVQSVSVYNVIGQEVLNRTINSTNANLDISSLNTGVYVIRALIDGNVVTSKFIKE
ncbi:MAG: T9SS type A sorting domain-containing protein, partial [Flavobacterium sp.]|nr:T9SS type A sorting domain-containing protein [Flavobacterium sp.]